jgi:Flp pilus assembly protein TadD
MAAYLPALRCGFVWDDDAHVTANATLVSVDGLRRIWTEPSATPQYYPLVHTTFWLEHHLWGNEPLGYHLDNVLLHALNAILVWIALRRLRAPGAWFAAALFALHPVHVESVAWITERKNVLSGFFYLLAFLAFVRYYGLDGVGEERPFAERDAAAPGSRSRGRMFVLGTFLFLCALLSKTVSATLPVALAIVIWWKRGAIRRREAAPLALLAALGALLASVTVVLERQHVGARGAAWDLSFVERCLIAGRALWFYAWKLVCPFDLTFMYPRWSFESSSPAAALLPLGALAVAVLLWLLRGRIGRGALAAVLFFIVTLGPALGFVNVFPMRYSFVADHFQYLASLGLLALAAGLAAGSLPPRRIPALLAGSLGAALLVTLGVLTWRQCRIYTDAEALWRDTIAKNPAAAIAHNNLAFIRSRRGETDAAIAGFNEALRLEPDFLEAHIGLGALLQRQGRTEEAARHFAAAVRIRPDDLMAQYDLGSALLALGRPRESAEPLRAAVALEPLFVPAHEKLAGALAMAGLEREARAERAEALRIRAWILATHVSASIRNGDEAIRLAQEASAITGNGEPRFLDTLAAALAEAGRFQDAAAAAARAVELARGRRDTALAAEIDSHRRAFAAGEAVRDRALSRLQIQTAKN